MVSVGFALLIICPFLFVGAIMTSGLIRVAFLIGSFVCGILGIIFSVKSEYRTAKEIKKGRLNG